MIQFTAEQYIADVLSGQQVVNKWVRKAVERHVKDLETGAERGLYFDETAAKTIIAFCALTNHSKGEWAGQPVILEPWQQFHLWALFGWKRADGMRRFRTSYLEVARKNGKTTVAAAVGLKLLAADGEPGAEIYTAATKREQARIAHSEATRMVRGSPQLKKLIKPFKDNLHIPNTASKFEPLGRDSNSTDGLNIHGAIVDELHAHKTRDMWDVLVTATGSRRQPLVFAITTAGYDRHSVCYEQHDYTKKVLSGIVEDDTHFGLIYSLDKGDDWQDESNWIKANPNLGVSKKLDDMRRKAEKAKAAPAALNAFLRLELNIWTQVAERWLDPDKWRVCNGVVDAEELKGRKCYGGLDLSSTIDITAWVMVFPPVAKDPFYRALCRFFIPEESIQERSRRDRVPYESWLRDGHIFATPGNVVDYDFIIDQIKRDAAQFDLVELAFDRWGATHISTKLMEAGLDVVEFGQGFRSLSAPSKELERLVISQQLAHGGHPTLAWMADNVIATQDPSANIKPDKKRSIEKIDGIIALVMGIARATAAGATRESAYKKRGIRAIG